MKKIIIAVVTTLLLIFSVSFVFYQTSINNYKQYIFNSQGLLLNDLVSKHPNIKKDIIYHFNNIQSSDNSFLDKYGIDKDNILELAAYKSYQQDMFNNYILSTSIISLIVISTLALYLVYLERKVKRIRTVINDSLDNRPSLSLNEYEEGYLSALNNDIIKITNRLKSNNEALTKDKKYLEETLSDISHQLKTPLTSMYMINDLLSSSSLSEEDKASFLHNNQIQLERIEWLVTSLLKLSRLESGMIVLKKEKIKVKELVSKILSDLEILFELKEQHVEVDISTNLTIIGDFNWTKEALFNIIKNALEHTPVQGTIKIAAEVNPLYTLITVSDNGEGIAKKDLPHIFERFYKGTHNSKESIGIGLNMSKNIFERQNAYIEVTSEHGIGTTFLIKVYK